MLEKFTETMRELWSTSRGKLAIIATGAIAALIVVGILAVVVLPPTSRPSAVPTPTPAPPAEASEELFPDASEPTQAPGGPPVIAENGQVDIGGPGIEANVDGFVEPEKPEAKPNKSTGLTEWPAEIPLAELTTPVYEDVPAAECAAPQIPEARAMGNDMIAYLFTWDTRKASFTDWMTPVEQEWNRLYGYYGGEGMNGKGDTGTFEERLQGIGISESAWAGWAKKNVTSNVRINQVITTAPSPRLLQLSYTVTITRAGQGIDEQSIVETVDLKLTAPCAADNWPAERAGWDMTGLQLFDFAGWATPSE